MRISDWSSDVCSSDLVSMDSLTVDIGALAENDLAEGDFVELLGPSQSLAGVARDAGTIAYEILTRLGARHARIHVQHRIADAVLPGADPLRSSFWEPASSTSPRPRSETRRVGKA